MLLFHVCFPSALPLMYGPKVQISLSPCIYFVSSICLMVFHNPQKQHPFAPQNLKLICDVFTLINETSSHFRAHQTAQTSNVLEYSKGVLSFRVMPWPLRLVAAAFGSSGKPNSCAIGSKDRVKGNRDWHIAPSCEVPCIAVCEQQKELACSSIYQLTSINAKATKRILTKSEIRYLVLAQSGLCGLRQRTTRGTWWRRAIFSLSLCIGLLL